MPPGGLSGQPYGTLLGRPVIPIEQCSTLGTVGDIILADLKQFIADLPVPVIVGGCASYQAGLHLMRTGAVGVLVGVGPGNACTTRGVLGIGVPQAGIARTVDEAEPVLAPVARAVDDEGRRSEHFGDLRVARGT